MSPVLARSYDKPTFSGQTSLRRVPKNPRFSAGDAVAHGLVSAARDGYVSEKVRRSRVSLPLHTPYFIFLPQKLHAGSSCISGMQLYPDVGVNAILQWTHRTVQVQRIY